MAYRVGDIVKSTIAVGNRKMKDAVGIIKYDSDGMYLIEFNENIDGHNGNDETYKGKTGHCWWMYDDQFEPYYDESILFGDSPVNNYSKACWHCSPGGIVDRLAFHTNSIILCPVCGRVCDGRKV